MRINHICQETNQYVDALTISDSSSDYSYVLFENQLLVAGNLIMLDKEGVYCNRLYIYIYIYIQDRISTLT